MNNNKENLKREFIHNLRHYRHDVLNHIQIIKGYLSLNRVKEAQHILDKYVFQSHQEALLSQIGDTELAYFLLTYNWQQNDFVLDIECDLNSENIAQVGVSQRYLHDLFQRVFQVVEQCCHQSQENNHLYVLLEGSPPSLTLTFEYEGSWNDEKAHELMDELGAYVQSVGGELVVEKQTKYCAMFKINT